MLACMFDNKTRIDITHGDCKGLFSRLALLGNVFNIRSLLYKVILYFVQRRCLQDV